MITLLHALPAPAWDSLLALHLLVWGLLAAYGIHRLHLLRLFRSRSRVVRRPDPPAPWPRVTVQLPVYAERYAAARLLAAAAALDYPSDRLAVQRLGAS